MKLTTLGALAAAAAVARHSALAATSAHHSFASEFDAQRPIEIEGIVKEMRFSNPHSWIYLTVTLKSGEDRTGPSKARRRTRCCGAASAGPRCLRAPRFVSAVIRHATEPIVCAGSNIVLTKTGEKLFVGSQGTGAPGDIEMRRPRRRHRSSAASRRTV